MTRPDPPDSSDVERPQGPSARAENFIPWEQIEPLVRPGMTLHELGEAIFAKVGLPADPKKYRLRFASKTEGMETMARLRHGLRLISREHFAYAVEDRVMLGEHAGIA